MMNDTSTSAAPICTGRLLYPVAALLVLAYVNTFELWAILVSSIGPAQAALVPFVTLAAGLALAGWHFTRRRGATEFSPALLIAGLVLAGIGLMLTDPAYPAKRIHVPQYLLLALLLRRALSDHVGGAILTAAAIAVTMIFGIHDEMLQGLHPSRTYGLRDILVNTVSGASGAVMAVGVGLWRGPEGPFGASSRIGLLRIGIALAFQCAALILLVITLVNYVAAPPAVPPPVWAGAPLALGGVALLALVRSSIPSPGMRHFCIVIAWATIPLALYPVIPHVTPLVFH
jgi:hypothetical protein